MSDLAFWIGRFGKVNCGSKSRPIRLSIRVRAEHAHVLTPFANTYGGETRESCAYGRSKRNAMVEWTVTGGAAYHCLRDAREELFYYDNYVESLKAVYNYEKFGVEAEVSP